MADGARLTDRIAAALPYVLPVLGGGCGAFLADAMGDANPVIGIAGGAIVGWGLAAAIVRLLDRL